MSAQIPKRKSITINEQPNKENTSNDSSDNLIKVEWSEENELIMVEWCDIAQCYKWMHSTSHSAYSTWNAWMTIPAITLSTISGTASFAQASLPLEYQTYAPMAIGTINILIGILTTVQQYLKISELNEAHRVAMISWDKFARNIRIELAKSPNERMSAEQFIAISRQEFDRLMETSPSIPPNLVDRFNTVFKGKPNSKERELYDALKKPDICNIIVSANDARHPWYLEAKQKAKDAKDIELRNAKIAIQEKEQSLHLANILIQEKENALNNVNLTLSEKNMLIVSHEMDLLKKKQQEEELELLNTELQNKVLETEQLYKEQHSKEYTEKLQRQNQLIEDYIETFTNEYGRKPHPDEVKDHFENDEDSGIDMNILQAFLSSYLLDENNVAINITERR
jgi:hypothetical protein